MVPHSTLSLSVLTRHQAANPSLPAMSFIWCSDHQVLVLSVYKTFLSILSQTQPTHALKLFLSRSPKMCMLLTTTINFQFSSYWMNQKYLTFLLLNKLISLGFHDPHLLGSSYLLLLSFLCCLLLFFLMFYMQWGILSSILSLFFFIYTMVSQLWHYWHLGPDSSRHCRT